MTDITFKTVRHCDVELHYFRGRMGTHDGFWIVEFCHSEKYSLTSFQCGGTIPTNLAEVANEVTSFNDSTGEGITGQGCTVHKIGADDDSARFIVHARVQSARAGAA